jgi:hypothetical protein
MRDSIGPRDAGRVIMASPSVSAQDLRQLLGDVDDVFIERIVETEASLDDVVEALHDVEDEREFGEVPRVPTSAIAAEVRVILRELFAATKEEDEDEEALPIIDLFEDRHH